MLTIRYLCANAFCVYCALFFYEKKKCGISPPTPCLRCATDGSSKSVNCAARMMVPPPYGKLIARWHHDTCFYSTRGHTGSLLVPTIHTNILIADFLNIFFYEFLSTQLKWPCIRADLMTALYAVTISLRGSRIKVYDLSLTHSLTHSLIWRPSRIADTPPLLPISRYGHCLFVADVCLCSEVLSARWLLVFLWVWYHVGVQSSGRV